jgi:hypothetical protein
VRPTSCLCTGCNGSGRVALLLFVQSGRLTPRLADARLRGETRSALQARDDRRSARVISASTSRSPRSAASSRARCASPADATAEVGSRARTRVPQPRELSTGCTARATSPGSAARIAAAAFVNSSSGRSAPDSDGRHQAPARSVIDVNTASIARISTNSQPALDGLNMWRTIGTSHPPRAHRAVLAAYALIAWRGGPRLRAPRARVLCRGRRGRRRTTRGS